MVNDLINLNEKNRIPVFLTIAVIVLIMIIGLTSQQRDQLNPVERSIRNLFLPVQRVVTQNMARLEEGIVTLIRSSEIREENLRLREEKDALSRQMIELQLSRDEIAELQNLRQTLNSIDRFRDLKPVTANVIAKSPGNWFEMFTIDAGTRNGVRNDSVVIGSGGLVGRVYETGGSWAKVISIIDNSSSVSFQVLRNRSLQGILSGSVTKEISGYLFDPEAEVVVGDQLITTGIGLYPQGILIGEVTAVGRTPDLLLKSVEVDPVVNFQRLNRVLVLSPQPLDEER